MLGGELAIYVENVFIPFSCHAQIWNPGEFRKDDHESLLAQTSPSLYLPPWSNYDRTSFHYQRCSGLNNKLYDKT